MLGCNVWLLVATLSSEAIYLFYCAMRLKSVDCTGMQVQSYSEVSAPLLCDHNILYTQCLIRNALPVVQMWTEVSQCQRFCVRLL